MIRMQHIRIVHQHIIDHFYFNVYLFPIAIDLCRSLNIGRAFDVFCAPFGIEFVELEIGFWSLGNKRGLEEKRISIEVKRLIAKILKV